MSQPILLVSSDIITQEQLHAFLSAVGAATVRSGSFQGTMFKGASQIWIGLQNKELEYFDTDKRKLVEQKLGGNPQTSIVIEISREPGSQELAVGFVCAFAKWYPCIVDNLRGDAWHAIYSMEELLELCESGEDFWE